MNWLWLVSYFFGGVFAANAIPHFVAGTMGRPFQSPFAKPPGEGLSSATVNVLWGFFNAVVGYLLVARVGSFQLRATSHIPIVLLTAKVQAVQDGSLAHLPVAGILLKPFDPLRLAGQVADALGWGRGTLQS